MAHVSFNTSFHQVNICNHKRSCLEELVKTITDFVLFPFRAISFLYLLYLNLIIAPIAFITVAIPYFSLMAMTGMFAFAGIAIAISNPPAGAIIAGASISAMVITHLSLGKTLSNITQIFNNVPQELADLAY